MRIEISTANKKNPTIVVLAGDDELIDLNDVYNKLILKKKILKLIVY